MKTKKSCSNCKDFSNPKKEPKGYCKSKKCKTEKHIPESANYRVDPEKVNCDYYKSFSILGEK